MTDAYQLAYDYAMTTSAAMFVTGKAGTGKTTFLRKLRENCPKQMAIVAPTGVAAINAEGVTIHSFFQLPPWIFPPTDENRRLLFSELQLRQQKRRVLQNLELLIIDEISMVRADLLDTIDMVLRHFKHHPSLPFGGVQVIFIGDLYQLSPVAREDDWKILKQYYRGPYFFQAQVFQSLRPVYIELDHVFRQSNQQFVTLLNEVRNNKLSKANRELLNSRYIATPPKHIDGLVLSTHNRKVDAINERELAQLKGKCYTFNAQIKDIFPESSYPADETLQLKEGAQVMFIKNDISPDKLFYNGKIGIITSIKGNEIYVQSEGDEEPILVPLADWENIRYVAHENSDTIESEVVGTFRQFPLRLAWAVTIHKAQGLTFDKVMIDAADAFAAGQVYVALSRCRSLEGITLLSPIPQYALTNAKDVIEFSQNQSSLTKTAEALNNAEQSFLISIILTIFDFRDIYEKLQEIRKLMSQSGAFSKETSIFLLHRAGELQGLQTIAEQFQRQLQQILNALNPDYDFLHQRLEAAYKYFAPKIEEIIKQFAHIRFLSSEYKDTLEMLHLLQDAVTDIERKEYIMDKIQLSANVDTYYHARQEFKPKITTNIFDQLIGTYRKFSPMSHRTKSKKGKSVLETIEMHLSGKDMQTIARERHITIRTVIKHLQEGVTYGLIEESSLPSSAHSFFE